MKRTQMMSVVAGVLISASTPAMAQEADLASMEVGTLRPEVQRRYDEALAATITP